MFAKNYTKTFPYCPESMKPYSETSTELRKIIHTVNIVSSVLRSATSISEGIFVGTLPFGHVCIILDDNSQTCLLDMFQLSNSEYKFCILDCTGV